MMTSLSMARTVAALFAACGFAIGVAGPAHAEVADLSNVPLANAPSNAVLPNLMYVLDDSGSMMWDYMPDNVFNLTTGQSLNNCKTASGSVANVAAVQCASGATSVWGEPPYHAAQFNQIYYNPDITYSAGVSSLGLSLGNANPAAAKNDAYLDATPKNLVTAYPEVYYCNTANPTSVQLTNNTVCRRNGIENVSVGTPYFLYWSNSATAPLGAYPLATGTTSTTFNQQAVSNSGHPYYFTITPHEYCSDTNLVNCQLANANGSAPVGFTIPAPLRYCNTTANAASSAAVSDPAGTAAPKCGKKFDVTNYPFPRYGRFTRTDIVAATTTYPKKASAVRTDCAAATYCTYAEELQNFANWYSYYRIRITMMKTSTGHAFLSIDDRYRVGFITINPNSPVTSNKYLAINTFNAGQKSAWYTLLYGQTNNGSTPLRQALSRIGRHYAGITTGINSGMPDPVQYSCQQNFTLLTTDGYYNDSASNAVDINNNPIGNQDNVADTFTPPFVSRATGTLDALGAQVTASTPATIVEQQICSGNGSTTFGGNTGTQQLCGCSTSAPLPTRIVQRTTTQTANTTTTEGVVTGSSTNNTYAFTNITSCTPPLVVTTTTPVTETAQNVCNRKNSTAYTAAANGTNTQSACNCSTNSQMSLIQRTVTYNKVVVTTNGVAAAPTYNSPSTGFATMGTACTTTMPTAAATIVATGTSTNTNNGGTTLAITFSPNPQTTTGSATTAAVAGGTANTLADVAMYYYKTDLRTSGTVATNNVPATGKDFANTQHMTTFTLGLGLQGNMDYTQDYETNALSDFGKIKSSANGCAWSGAGTCDWPAPVAATPSALDDLWHAAVNGRGVYYSASNPNTLADGLSGALAALKIQTAAASASATSSPNITQTDNFIYSSTFRTVKWDGEIVARRLDPATANVLPAIVWSAQSMLDGRVSATSDSRAIWTFSTGSGTKLKSFAFASLTAAASGGLAAEQSFFANQCTVLSQCPLLTATQQGLANDGNNMVGYLRGQNANASAGSPVFRIRDHVLGDSADSVPAYVKAPVYGFADAVTPGYASFKTANAARQSVLYVGANDGMLHAFNGDTGAELWAYVPHMVYPMLSTLATDNWDVRHLYSADGSPQTMDVFNSATGAWKTILVGGLNKGGRGYFALDVTDPNNPKGLWEICADSTLCAISDTDIGSSYGNPVITKRASDGRWVVLIASGLNNVAPGSGRGYLFVLDAFTGAILRKVDTGAGDTTTPSGFARISVFANSFNTDNTGLTVYGGDLLGNLWRIDITVDPPAVLKMATLMDGTGKPQSITTRPEVGVINSSAVVFVGTGRFLGANDLPDPATLSPSLPWAYTQSIYAIKDKNASYGNPRSRLVQQTIIDNGSTTRTTSTNSVDFAVNDGWFADFNPSNSSPGERVNIDPQLVLGTLVLVTNAPNNNVCTVGGDSFVYQFDYAHGTYVTTAAGRTVAQRTYGQSTVGIAVVRATTGAIAAEQSLAGGQPPLTQGISVAGSGSAGRRVSWRQFLNSR